MCLLGEYLLLSKKTFTGCTVPFPRRPWHGNCQHLLLSWSSQMLSVRRNLWKESVINRICPWLLTKIITSETLKKKKKILLQRSIQVEVNGKATFAGCHRRPPVPLAANPAPSSVSFTAEHTWSASTTLLPHGSSGSGVLSWRNFCKAPIPDLSAFIVGVTQSDCS